MSPSDFASCPPPSGCDITSSVNFLHAARELISSEPFQELEEVLSSWTEDELRTLTRADIISLFPGDSRKIGMGLRFLRKLPLPGTSSTCY